MSEPKVSIIVPVYNVEKYLGRCVDSLRNQTLKDIEIILVDDASTDGSAVMCDNYQAQDNRIKVIHKNNEGAGIARNSGIMIAKGKYIGFVDSDDYIGENMFETLYNKAELYNSDLVMSGVIFVGGNMFSEEGTYTTKKYFDKDTHFDTDLLLKELRLGIIGAMPDEVDDSRYGMSVWKNLFKREIIINNNLKFESERKMLSEDALFMLDYIAVIDRATGINEAFYYYFRNQQSISKSYKQDRFDKGLVFVNQVIKRLEKDIPKEKYQVYINRFFQAFCRVVCIQEIMYSTEAKTPYKVLKKRLKYICTNPLSQDALSAYPLRKLPIKQAVFAYSMKYRLYRLQKFIVSLRKG